MEWAEIPPRRWRTFWKHLKIDRIQHHLIWSFSSLSQPTRAFKNQKRKWYSTDLVNRKDSRHVRYTLKHWNCWTSLHWQVISWVVIRVFVSQLSSWFTSNNQAHFNLWSLEQSERLLWPDHLWLFPLNKLSENQWKSPAYLEEIAIILEAY